MKSFQQGSVVQPVSKQLVNGGPAAVSTQMTTLGTNLLELDTLLDELDAVELSDDVLQHTGVGEFNLLGERLVVGRVVKFPVQFTELACHRGRTRACAIHRDDFSCLRTESDFLKLLSVNCGKTFFCSDDHSDRIACVCR